MSLGIRMKRLIKADLHGFVEGLEDPKWVLAQAIRDMEEELEKTEGAITAKESHLLKLIEGIASSEESINKLEQDINFAIQEKREEIAKSLIRKLLITQQHLAEMTVEQGACHKQLKAMEVELRTRQDSYERVRSRSEQVNLSSPNDDVFASAERLVPEDQTLAHQVELEFLRRIQALKEVDGAA